jgi:PAS domain S-box-containing protein
VNPPAPASGASAPDLSLIALQALDHIDAMVAYWDAAQVCRYANASYRVWFGRSPEEMLGITLEQLLGPIYPKNQPYILGALRGEPQLFERQIPLPDGRIRESIARYTPDVVDGVVRGFFVHVADVTPLREREKALQKTIAERDAAEAEAQKLRGLLPICAHCKAIRDEANNWVQLETYIAQRSEAQFSHGICPKCAKQYFPDLYARAQSRGAGGAT